MLTATTPYNRPLGDGLVIKSIRSEADVERLEAFYAQIFGGETAHFAAVMLLHHPATRPEHWLYIEHEENKQIVAALCLIPWTWCYEEITLKSGEVGIVGTLESYRNRGLVRELMARHRELLKEGEFDLSHIQGIPYFYRQFGYEYAMPLDVFWHLELHNLPDNIGDNPYHFRLATVQDIPLLTGLYEQAAQSLSISTVRDEKVWHYILETSPSTVVGGETWLVLDANQTSIAYFRISQHGFGNGLIVNETSRMNMEISESVLWHLKTVARERSKPNIRLALPDNNDLLYAARGFGAHNDGHYPWQMHLVDVARLLRKIAPVLERRLATSIFAGLTRTVCLNLYREAFELRFENSRLIAVNPLGFTDKGDIKLPPLLLAPLLLGYRNREELSKMYPDVFIHGQFQHLVDVLFPKMESFIYTIF